MGEVRVVPSGKIYRQIFDAEVQLVRTLGETRRKSKHHAVPLESGRIPIVRRLDTPTGHIFSTRQRTWMEGLLNDGITENPVLHRNAVLSAIKPKEVVEQNNAVREVKGLPDVVVPARLGSSIIPHLLADKQGNHGATVKKLEEELAAISRELEKRFTEAAEYLLQEVEKSCQTIQELWSKTENNTDSTAKAFENLQEVWEAIVNQSLHRRKLINELDKTYKDFEKERVKKVTAVLKDCLEALETIAYIPSGDIHRFIDKEAMLINQALLANQRAMNKLYVNLMETDLIHGLSERQKCNLKVQELNTRQKNEVLQNFKDFLAKDWNAGLKNEKHLLVQEQQNLNYKRIQRLEDVVNMNPFDLNKATLLQWYDSVRAVNQEIDSLHIQYASKLQVYHEKVYHEWMTELDKSEEMLVNSGVCTREEAKNLIVSDFLPIIGNLQRVFENEQFNVEKHMEILDQQMERQCKWIYSVIKEATQLWEVHQEILAEQEQQLKDRIDNCRKKHDKSNQMREANLDMLIDQLRQRNSEGELKSDLKKVKCLLDGIKRGYEDFYQKQMEIVNNYPSTSEKELLRFSTAISKCFDVIEIYKPNKPKIIIDAPSEVASADEVAVTQSEMSEDIHGDIPDESERNESTREEASDLSVTPHSEEGAELSGQETSSHIQGISIESISKQDETEESRNASDWSDQELSRYTSQHLSEEASEEKMGAISPKEQSGALEETDHGKMSTKSEHFKTSKGNIYTVMLHKKGKNSMNVISFLTETEEQKHLQDYMKHAFIPEAIFLDLKKKVRLNFFELLEDWYDKAMNNAKNIAVIKKKEFKAELELRKHLHEPREKRIKMDVFNVRAVELRLHRDRVKRHCRGVEEVLTKLKTDFRTLQSEHCKSIVEFRNNIHNLEEIFKTAIKSERLINLLNSLHNKQEKYMNSVNKLFREFQNMLDKSLGKLQDDNAQFITSFRLFANGGNYTPQEIQEYNERIEEVTSGIANTEGSVMVDLEIMEAMSLEQSTAVIKETEDKYTRYTLDLIFIEKIKRFLTNAQTKIKTEVALSNSHTVNITSHLEQFERKIDACARPNLDKEVVLPKELHHFSKIIQDLMEKRALYLNCLVDLVIIEAPLQGQIATAAHVEFQTRETKINENLLLPSRKGKAPTEDVAVTVIKEILHVHKSEVLPDTDLETADDISTVKASQVSFGSASQNARSTAVSSKGQKATTPSAIKYSKVNRFDPRYQVFGETVEKSDQFKGSITFILWESTNALMAVAEDYYKKKDRQPVYRPEYLRDTFEQCADELIQKMLSYQAQADIYHSNCLQEFREQLKMFEELVSSVPPFLIEEVLKQHLDLITKTLAEKRSIFREKLNHLENTKNENKRRLRPILGHPNNAEVLESLCKEEEERQNAEAAEINRNVKDQKHCILEHAQNFVATLSSLSEQLLLEYDNFLIVDNILSAQPEAAGETTRQKRAGPLLQEDENTSTTEMSRESRTWPGIPAYELSQICKLYNVQRTASMAPLFVETASVTTVKTILADLAVIRSRDAAYVKYKQHFLQEMSQIERETEGLLINAQNWRDGWRDSVVNIMKLYALVRPRCVIPDPAL
ncbi:coiled-coil domain-containing protein 180 isoform X2 [Stegostoma tigrinum]|uniref:coiled-coil domain-containing protein 180 isoform X2 n=1 Tax=Stegostoma tigrinum TaxID=3053191 RepID=UPI00202BA21D|nr:coiled-coil domain-containing protein 180 isoform X2 [Stegostoma tigrinum]